MNLTRQQLSRSINGGMSKAWMTVSFVKMSLTLCFVFTPRKDCLQSLKIWLAMCVLIDMCYIVITRKLL